jgi:hypothetical protein
MRNAPEQRLRPPPMRVRARPHVRSHVRLHVGCRLRIPSCMASAH